MFIRKDEKKRERGKKREPDDVGKQTGCRGNKTKMP